MVYPRELILFADGIWPMCTKVPGVECTEPEKECEDCEGADSERVTARKDEPEDPAPGSSAGSG